MDEAGHDESPGPHSLGELRRRLRAAASNPDRVVLFRARILALSDRRDMMPQGAGRVCVRKKAGKDAGVLNPKFARSPQRRRGG